jgi:antitoxin component YwqK of YwqJK toxin-antitoxin module
VFFFNIWYCQKKIIPLSCRLTINWELYYSNGQLNFKGNYVNGKQHGYWESYFSDGQLNYKGNFVNGKQHGYWEEYWSKRELTHKTYYI